MPILILGVEWEVLEKIDDDSNGQVHRIRGIEFGTERAIKTVKNGWDKYLENEAAVYNELQKGGYRQGFPKMLFYGTGINRHSRRQTVLVTTLLGTNFDKLREPNGCCLSVPSVLRFGRQAVLLLKQLHQLGIVHDNIKPESFVLGRKRTVGSRRVHLVDFSMCFRYKVKVDRKWIHNTLQRYGNAESSIEFSSHRANTNHTPSPRDDLESLIYVMVYLVNGLLPWRIPTQFEFNAFGSKHSTLLDEACHLKRNISNEILFKGMPAQMDALYTYVRKLDCEKTPNYDYIHDLLSVALQESKHTLSTIELD